MDFTLEKYKELLTALELHKQHRIKHDVDKRPLFSLRTAEIESNLGIHTTYYFRSKDFTSPDTILSIARLGHSIGYHYETLATCRGDYKKAYDLFISELNQLRRIVPVTTACAHGSPLSKWNNQLLWNQYDIHSLGIHYEPMLDTDFSHTLYLTDTGRRWDGGRASIRDKVEQPIPLSFHTTDDIIHALNDINHPIHHYAILFNTHPQRWMPFGPAWLTEALLQNLKNPIKSLFGSYFNQNQKN